MAAFTQDVFQHFCTSICQGTNDLLTTWWKHQMKYKKSYFSNMDLFRSKWSHFISACMNRTMAYISYFQCNMNSMVFSNNEEDEEERAHILHSACRGRLHFLCYFVLQCDLLITVISPRPTKMRTCFLHIGVRSDIRNLRNTSKVVVGCSVMDETVRVTAK